MSKGYIVCDIGGRNACVSGCASSPRAVSLPGGNLVFHFVLENGQAIVVSVQGGVVSLFDMAFTIPCSEVRLYIDDIADNYSCSSVTVVIDGKCMTVGDLILSEDMTIFEAEVIGVENANRLWTKAVTMYGTSAS